MDENQVDVARIIEFARAQLSHANHKKRCLALRIEYSKCLLHAHNRQIGNLLYNNREIFAVALRVHLHVEQSDAQSLLAPKTSQRFDFLFFVIKFLACVFGNNAKLRARYLLWRAFHYLQQFRLANQRVGQRLRPRKHTTQATAKIGVL